MTFSDYFVALQRRWRIWVAMLGLGLLVAAIVNAYAPVKYTATATLFVTVAERSDENQGAQNFQNSQFAVQRVKSYSSLVKSPRVLEPVIRDLGLNLSERELARRTNVTSPPETVLMEVEVVDGDAVRASETANAVSAELGDVIEDIETAPGGTVSNVKVSVTQPANVPTSASSPRTLLNLLFGAVAGLTIGFAAAVLRNHFDRRIKSADDLRALMGVSPLGSTIFDPSYAKRALVALDWRSDAAERYRTIRTALKFAAIDSEIRHFVVSSPVAGGGKTTSACNLAISWAQSGASVCLVEADLRRPNVATYLGIEGNLGLSDVLVGEASLDEVLVAWNHGMLTALPAGSLPPDPSALLGSEAMHGLVATLAERFDVVIYDSPPLLPVTDAIVLGKQVDGIVLAVRYGATRREELSTCVEAVQNARVKVLGSVLTCTPQRGALGEHTYRTAESPTRPELAPLSAEPGKTAAKSVKKPPADSGSDLEKRRRQVLGR